MSRLIGIALGLVLWVSLPSQGAAAEFAGGADRAAAATLKERLSGKRSDPQRVNDCKVPPEWRDDPKRSAACGATAGSPGERAPRSGEALAIEEVQRR